MTRLTETYPADNPRLCLVAEIEDGQVAGLREELVQAEAASSLPAELDFAAIETLVVDLHRRSLNDQRFNSAG